MLTKQQMIDASPDPIDDLTRPILRDYVETADEYDRRGVRVDFDERVDAINAEVSDVRRRQLNALLTLLASHEHSALKVTRTRAGQEGGVESELDASRQRLQTSLVTVLWPRGRGGRSPVAVGAYRDTRDERVLDRVKRDLEAEPGWAE